MKPIKFIRTILLSAVALTSAVSLQSCLDDDAYNDYYLTMPIALVTAKTSADNTFYLQLDDSTTLLPVNISSSPFGEKEVRALVNYNEVDEAHANYSQAVHINWIDSILTKDIAVDKGPENDTYYGNDPVEMIADWVTIAEDGYLTLRFRTAWGNTGTKHFVNLLAINPDNPYEVEFRHNAFGDINGHQADALVAFNLNKLPDTNGETVKLKLKWNSYSGEKTYEFDYCTRKSTDGNTSEIAKSRTSHQVSVY